MDRRTEILDAAERLIRRRGLNAMSFQDLSEAVGIRKASVHHHFASKADLVEALVSRYRERFGERTHRVLNGKGTGAAKLRRYCALFTDSLRQGNSAEVCLCGVLLAERESLSEEGGIGVRAFFSENRKLIESLLRLGMADGTIARRKDPEAAAQMVLAMLEGALLLARDEGGAERMERTVAAMLDALSAKP